MDPLKILKLGEKYAKRDLIELLDQPTLSTVREGIFHCKNSDATLFFVDLEKKGKEDRFHFDDFYEGEYFHWDSQTTQHINSPKIQEIIKGDRTPHLLIRISSKIKNKTQPYIYCGRLVYSEYDKGTSKPVHIVFENIDYDDFTKNEDLQDIYLWKPSKVGKSPKTKISKKGKVSTRRKGKYRKPNQTERAGLVTNRVGQGYYRQEILDKWDGKCGVTGISKLSILIASHIVPWSESNADERLDVENGILLSPNLDALFDRHLISFLDNGEMLISSHILVKDRKALGIDNSMKIAVSEGMKPYLIRHRATFDEKN